MAKKKDKPAASGPKPSSSVPTAEPDLGDLRLVERYVSQFLSGDPEAQKELMTLGRDAAGITTKLAEQHQSEELKAFAKRLVAVPPQVKTNLMELRTASVMTIVKDGLARARSAANAGETTVEGAQVALFDPVKVIDALIRGGRPRKDPSRIAAGDLIWFALEHAGSLRVRVAIAAPQEGQDVLTLRLVVESGLVFVGPPEAADGPRLGEVRLDPFRTGFDDYVARGRLVRVRPGRYRASAHQGTPPEIRIFLEPDASEMGSIPVDLAALGRIPALRTP